MVNACSTMDVPPLNALLRRLVARRSVLFFVERWLVSVYCVKHHSL
jgi:hypothetical protein